MSSIHIKNLEVTTCHGCFESEKVTPQPFIFDCVVDYDFEGAANSDCLKKTLDYGEMMQVITDYASSQCFNLIETLCYRTAALLMQKYPIDSISMTVRKPHAPVPLPFEDVCVNVKLERSKVILSLGSNLGDRIKTLEYAVKRLKENPAINILKVSSYLENPPYGGVAKQPFVNMAVMVETYLSPKTLLDYIHTIEAEAHRERKIHWGDRTLDIDIIFYGNKIIDTKELVIPHADYQNRDFVLIPMNEICPDFVCPLYRMRIKDLLNKLLLRKKESDETVTNS